MLLTPYEQIEQLEVDLAMAQRHLKQSRQFITRAILRDLMSNITDEQIDAAIERRLGSGRD